MRTLLARAFLTLGLAPFISADARAEFAVGVTPPRLELTAKAGSTLRHVLEISNAALTPVSLNVRSADWSYSADGTVSFHDDLQTGSCRPWLAIERRKLLLNARQTWRYRIEISVPHRQLPAECRLAILFEGDDSEAVGPNGTVPVAGRLGVIVYVGVDGVQPVLEVLQSRLEMRDGRLTPLIEVRNTGLAHGRLEGFLKGTDANGTALDVAPSTFPVLPGEVRWLPLVLSRPGRPDTQATAAWPLRVRGKLEWGMDQAIQLDRLFDNAASTDSQRPPASAGEAARPTLPGR